MTVHIAIPEPTSTDSAYNQRSLPPYLAALHSAGVTPVIVPLHERPDRVARLLLGVQGILLPGSGFDIDPALYAETRIPECAQADPHRAAVDEQLLRDAFIHQKPILGICYGTQTLNVWLRGALIQHIESTVNHTPGRTVLDAHPVRIDPGSRLAALLQDFAYEQLVNSSHHQSVKSPGKNLRVTAVCPEDGVIEAIELDSAEHFVVGVQWHPERTYTHSAFSRAIFSAFVQAANAWHPRHLEAPVAAS